jgi:hypothetical protein
MRGKCVYYETNYNGITITFEYLGTAVQVGLEGASHNLCWTFHQGMTVA